MRTVAAVLGSKLSVLIRMELVGVVGHCAALLISGVRWRTPGPPVLHRTTWNRAHNERS